MANRHPCNPCISTIMQMCQSSTSNRYNSVNGDNWSYRITKNQNILLEKTYTQDKRHTNAAH